MSKQAAPPPGYSVLPVAGAPQQSSQPVPIMVTGPPQQFIASPPMNNNFELEQRIQKLQQIAVQYEIQPAFVAKLRQLENFEILLVLDDSGSMNQVLSDNASSSNPYGPQKTRWNELCQSATIICDIAACFDKTGLDVYFLNRPPMRKVTSGQQIQVAFNAAPPQGYTPLARTLRQVFQEKAAEIRERKCLVMLFTDGSPTNDQGEDDVRNFIQVVKNRHPNVYMTIVACTDNMEDVAYLNKMDRDIPRLDVVDDYKSESAEIRRAQGPNFRFSFGDYMVKSLLGSIDASFDALDERKKKCVIC